MREKFVLFQKYGKLRKRIVLFIEYTYAICMDHKWDVQNGRVISQGHLVHIITIYYKCTPQAVGGEDEYDEHAPFMRKPFCVYRGHTADLLDLSWSKVNFLFHCSHAYADHALIAICFF